MNATVNRSEEDEDKSLPEPEGGAEETQISEAPPTTEEKEIVEEEPAKEEVEEAEAEAEEEEEEEEKEKEIVEEKIFTIPLGRTWAHPFPTRTPRAVRIIREFMERHMKTEHIRIHPTLNVVLWRRGIEKPPRRVRVRVTRDKEGVVEVHPAKK